MQPDHCVVTRGSWPGHVACVADRTERQQAYEYDPRMLHNFLRSNRDVLIDRCRAKVARRSAPNATAAQMNHGIPVLIDQLIETLKREQTAVPAPRSENSGPLEGRAPVQTEVGATAMLHGRELAQQGFTVDQVVHNYGDLCQAVTELASEVSSPIEVDEFRTLNRVLDDAIAGAVTEHSLQQRDSLETGQIDHDANQRVRALANDLSTHIKTAALAISAIKAGNVGLNGATGAILDLSLISLRTVLDRALAPSRVH